MVFIRFSLLMDPFLLPQAGRPIQVHKIISVKLSDKA